MAVYVTPLRQTHDGVRAILRADTPQALAVMALTLDLDLSALNEPNTYRAGYDLLPHEREAALASGARGVSFQQMRDLLDAWRMARFTKARQMEDLL